MTCLETQHRFFWNREKSSKYFEVEGYQKYLEEAKSIYKKYCQEIQSVLDLYGIESEEEAFTGCFLNLPSSLAEDSYEISIAVKAEISRIWGKYKRIFHKKDLPGEIY